MKRKSKKESCDACAKKIRYAHAGAILFIDGKAIPYILCERCAYDPDREKIHQQVELRLRAAQGVA